MSSPSTRSRSRNASENDPAAASSSRPANPLAFLGLKRVGDEDDNDVKKAATKSGGEVSGGSSSSVRTSSGGVELNNRGLPARKRKRNSLIYGTDEVVSIPVRSPKKKSSAPPSPRKTAPSPKKSQPTPTTRASPQKQQRPERQRRLPRSVAAELDEHDDSDNGDDDDAAEESVSSRRERSAISRAKRAAAREVKSEPSSAVKKTLIVVEPPKRKKEDNKTGVTVVSASTSKVTEIKDRVAAENRVDEATPTGTVRMFS